MGFGIRSPFFIPSVHNSELKLVHVLVCAQEGFPTLRSFGTKFPPMWWAWSKANLNPINHLHEDMRRVRPAEQKWISSYMWSYQHDWAEGHPCQAAAKEGVPVALCWGEDGGEAAQKELRSLQGTEWGSPWKRIPQGLCSVQQFCHYLWKKPCEKGGSEYFYAFLLVVFIHLVLDINLCLIDQKAADPRYVNMILISSLQVTYWFSAHCLLELWSSVFFEENIKERRAGGC